VVPVLRADGIGGNVEPTVATPERRGSSAITALSGM
jgi:hypothetical protein